MAPFSRLCLFLGTSLFPMAGLAAECPSFVPPSVEIVPNIRPAKIDSTQTLAFLRAKSAAGPDKVSGARHERPVGLTAASLKTNLSYKIASKSASSSRVVCAQISHFSMTFGFDDTIVYVAREIQRGSCGYKTVFDHEMTHVRIDEDIVRSYASKLRGLFEKELRHIGVVRASSIKEAEKKIEEAISVYTSKVTDELSKTRQARQAQIDTPSEYARLSRSCNGSLAELISKAR